MTSSIASRERAAMLRRAVLIFDQHCSIGYPKTQNEPFSIIIKQDIVCNGIIVLHNIPNEITGLQIHYHCPQLV